MIPASGDISDVPEPNDQAAIRKKDRLGTNEIIEDIKILLERHENPSDHLQAYLNQVEASIEKEQKEKLASVDRDYLKGLIEKHPFFKNPNNYHIRLITVMKYLKKKDVDISIPDMDLLVDEIIQSIDGVKKRGYGQYSRTRYF